MLGCDCVIGWCEGGVMMGYGGVMTGYNDTVMKFGGVMVMVMVGCGVCIVWWRGESDR